MGALIGNSAKKPTPEELVAEAKKEKDRQAKVKKLMREGAAKKI